MRRLEHHCKRLKTCSTTGEFLVRARGSGAQILPDHFKLSKILELVTFLGVLPLRQAQGQDFALGGSDAANTPQVQILSPRPIRSNSLQSSRSTKERTPGLAPGVHVHFSRLSHSGSV